MSWRQRASCLFNERLRVEMGDPGCLLLRRGQCAGPRSLTDHLTAEYRVRTEARGRAVDEWKIKPGGPDNHWLDCLVGCAVAGSMQGAILFGTDQKRERRRLTFAEYKARLGR